MHPKGAVAAGLMLACSLSAGAGLSWNSTTKQIDIANAGVYSAFVTLDAVPTP